MRRQERVLASGEHEARCTKCDRWKPIGQPGVRNATGERYWYWHKASGDWRTACRSCTIQAARDRAEARGRAPKPDAPKPDAKYRCGHPFHNPDASERYKGWASKRDCPACLARGPEAPKLPEPPLPGRNADGSIPDPDPDWLRDHVAIVPTGLYHYALLDALLLVESGIPVWLQGPPGTAKSTTAQQAAEALGLGFYPISCHELMSRTDLFGFRDANGTEHRTPLWDAYENGGVVLLDEVDNGNPNLLAALNSALSNGHCVFGSGTIVAKHDAFRVIATANTAGLGPEAQYVGRNGVDAATRDRFVTVHVPIDELLEEALAEHYSGGDIADYAAKIERRTLKNLKQRARNVAEHRDCQEVRRVVLAARAIVEAQYQNAVVTPRATYHAVTMVGNGFTTAEAVASKLVGLSEAERSAVVSAAGTEA